MGTSGVGACAYTLVRIPVVDRLDVDRLEYVFVRDVRIRERRVR